MKYTHQIVFVTGWLQNVFEVLYLMDQAAELRVTVMSYVRLL